MGNQDIIPIFKKKELTLDYLSLTYEDEAYKNLKFLWSAMEDFKVNLTLTQIMELISYREKASHYFNDLMSLLTDEKNREYIKEDFEKFKIEFSPKSDAERLIFAILINLSNELFWIDDVLKMEEYEL